MVYSWVFRFCRIIHNWHKACDGRGISSKKRSEYNQNMLEYILDSWMPWHRKNHDFSLVDINRSVLSSCTLNLSFIIQTHPVSCLITKIQITISTMQWMIEQNLINKVSLNVFMLLYEIICETNLSILPFKFITISREDQPVDMMG